MPKGKSSWVTVHKVADDNLYRVAADDAGRLLASWEEEPSIHLFDRVTKKHYVIAKPPAPPGLTMFKLDDLGFAKSGKHAIVYMRGMNASSAWLTVAYRIPLDGRGAPTMLFQQGGTKVHTSPRIAVFAVSADGKDCSHNGCGPVASFIAWEIGLASATKKTVLSRENLSSARIVWGSDEERLAMVVDERPSARHLLRWRAGEATASYTPLPKGPSSDTQQSWLTKSDDLVEVWLLDDKSLEIKRFPLKGEPKSTLVPPLKQPNPDDPPDPTVHALKERANGDLILQWGENLLLVPADKPARLLSVKPMIKGEQEWAGAMIYTPAPEAVWLGIEMGGGRDFVSVPLADLEKRAKVVGR